MRAPGGRRPRIAVGLCMLLLASALVVVGSGRADATVVNMALAIDADGTSDAGSWDATDGGGADSGPLNGWVRTLDLVRYRISFDTVGGPGAGNLTLRSTLPPGMVWADLPPVCLDTFIIPPSTVSEDQRTIVCNLGDIPPGYAADLFFHARALTSVANATSMPVRFEYEHQEGADSISGATSTATVQVSAGQSVDLVQNAFDSVIPGQEFQVEWGPAAGPSDMSGVVFDDLDGDGARDPGEPGLGGVDIAVHQLDGEPIRDAAGTPRTTTSAGDGSYSFPAVGPTTVKISIANTPAGRRITTPAAVELVAQGQPLDEIDFGFTTAGPGAGTATLSGTVYDDMNQSGVQDPGELGTADVEVRLTGVSDAGDPVDSIATTATDGTFNFSALAPSDANGYRVEPATRGLATNSAAATVPLVAGQTTALDLGFTTSEAHGMGVGVRWPFALMAGASGKGAQEVGAGSYSFVSDAGFVSANTILMNWSFPCGQNNDGINLLPLPTGHGGEFGVPDAVADSGLVTCSQPGGPGTDIVVDVAGADTSGRHLPTQAYNGDTIPADAHYLSVGYISTFTPAGDLPSCSAGVQLQNRLTGLSGINLEGQPLIDADPGNNSHAQDVLSAACNNPSAGFVPQFEFQLDEARDHAGVPDYDYSNGHMWDRWGDGYVTDAAPFSIWFSATNFNAVFDQAVVQCVAIDNARFRLVDRPFDPSPISIEQATDLDGVLVNPELVQVFDDDADPNTPRALNPGEFMLEYGAAGTGSPTAWSSGSGPVFFADSGEQVAGTRCGDGESGDSAIGWYDDPHLVPGGLAAVNIVRLRVPRIGPTDSLLVRAEVEAVPHHESPHRLPGATPGDPWPFATQFAAYMSFSINDQWPSVCCEWQRRVQTGHSLVRIDKTITPDDEVTIVASSGEEVTFELRGTANSLHPESGVIVRDVTITDVMPPRLSYVSGSATPAPSSVTVDGAGETTLVWDFGDVPSEAELPVVEYTARVDRDVLNGQALTNTAVISSPDDDSPESARRSQRTISAAAPLAFQVWKDAVEPVIAAGEQIRYRLNWVNRASTILGTQDLIDVLPYVGDGRVPATATASSLSPAAADLLTAAADPSVTIYVTNRAPAAVNEDPADPSNAMPGGSTEWCDVVAVTAGPVAGCPAPDLSDATAIRLVDTEPLAPVDPARRLELNLDSTAADGDVLTNRFHMAVVGVTNTAQTPDATVRVEANVVEGIVFHDRNGDGYMDVTEEPIESATIRLVGTTALGAPVDVVTSTAADGTYSFSVQNGDYSLDFTRPIAFDRWSPDRSAPAGLGSDAVWGLPGDSVASTAVFSFPGAEGWTWNAGVYDDAALGDFVFHDLDGDGLQDPGEPGLPGVVIQLLDVRGRTPVLDADGVAVADVVSGADGSYGFSNLRPGRYRLRFTHPDPTPGDPSDDFWLSPARVGSDSAVDSDPNPRSGVTRRIRIRSADAQNLDIDAGFHQRVRVGDRVFRDLDLDGRQDVGEPGVAGVRIDLHDGLGLPVRDALGRVVRTFTDGAGNYAFDGIRPGDYLLRIRPPFGWSPTVRDVGDDLGDSDAGTDGVAPVSVRSGQAEVEAGSGYSDSSVDFGLLRPARVVGRVWRDNDRNGIQNLTERGLPGIHVNLLDSGGSLLAATITGPHGFYQFSDLPPGDLMVEVEERGSFLRTVQGAGADRDLDSDVAVPDGRSALFSVNEADVVEIDAGLYQRSRVGRRVWFDLDGDGVQGAGEPGAPGVTVRLRALGGGPALDDAGAPVPDALTDADGGYEFEGFAFGDLRVEFVPPIDVAPSPVDQGDREDLDSDADPADGFRSQVLSVVDDEEILDVDAGFIPQADIAGFVYVDSDGDGDRAGETGIAGVTVLLEGFDAAGAPVNESAVTNASGAYSFDDLSPGLYTLREVQPPAYGDGLDRAGSLGAFGLAPFELSATSDEFLDIELTEDRIPSTENNFGELTAGTIGGTVFLDDDDSGSPAANPGLAGVTIQLSGNTAGGDPHTDSAVTDSDGDYLFAPVPNGIYTISEVQPAGFSDSPNTAATAIAGIVLTGGSSSLGNDFGELRPVTIGDRVWEDTNGDGQQSVGETGVAGVPVQLFDAADVLVNSTTTAADGTYQFFDDLGGFPLLAGPYRVEFARPIGYEWVTPDQGDDAVDSDVDPASNSTALIVFPTEVDQDSTDAGLYRPVSIAGTAWEDVDADGNRIAEPGVGGVDVRLLDIDGTEIAQTTSAADGTWTIANGSDGRPLTPGVRQILATAPTGRVFTVSDHSNPTLSALDSDVRADGMSPGFVLDPGVSESGLSIGVLAGATIGDLVWHDHDGDGVHDPGEPGIAGVSVRLVTTSGAPARAVGGGTLATAVSGADGSYELGPIGPGTYRIVAEPPPSWHLSPSTGTTALVDGDSDVSVLTGLSGDISVVSGDAVTGVDVGVHRPITVGDYAWDDADGDGVQDPDERGLVGVTVHLLDGAGATIATTVSDGLGHYHFPGLPPGVYSIEAELPDGSTHSEHQLGGDPSVDSDIDPLTARSTPTAYLSGDDAGGVDIGAVTRPHVGGSVYSDTDGDGVRDVGEVGIEGVQLSLTGVSNDGEAQARTTTSDPTGRYRFLDLPPSGPSGYQVAQTQPAGWLDGAEAVGTTGGVVASNDAIDGIALGSEDASLGNDFAELPPASLRGVVFVDSNLDGGRQAGEAGVADVAVHLTGLDDRGGAVDVTTTTDAAGVYSFDGLRPGDYELNESQPSGLDDGAEQPGTAGGRVVDNDRIGDIVLAPGEAASGYLFAEIDEAAVAGGEVRGQVYVDTTRDGKRDVQETDRVAGALVELVDSAGVVRGTTTSDHGGNFRMRAVEPGPWRVRVVAPAGYGVAPGGDVDVNVDTGTTFVDFGLTVGSLRSEVYVDDDGDGERDPGEPGIAGVAVTLTGDAADGTRIDRVAVTDSSGVAAFSSLLGGRYSIAAAQPVDFDDGLDRAGSAGGSVTNDRVDDIVLGEGEVADGYLFGEDRGVGSPTFISGRVFHDDDGDGIADPAERGLVGVPVTLRSGPTAVAVVVSGLDGAFVLHGVAPGSYSLDVASPPGFLATTPLSQPVALTAEGSDGHDFGLQLGPGGVPGRIEGVVFLDEDRDGNPGGGDRPIPFVTIELRSLAGDLLATTASDVAGRYRFDGVPDGSYDVTELQPAGHGSSTPDTVRVSVVAGDPPVHGRADFGDVLSTLAGAVYLDVDTDGARGPGEPGIPGVEMTLDVEGSLVTTLTAADGSFLFTDVPAGTHRLSENQPDGFGQGAIVAGSFGGVVGPDEVASIVVPVGTEGAGYLFGEVLTTVATSATVTGVVWIDTDGDGAMGPGEQPAPGAVVRLQHPAVAERVTTAGTDGRYRFDGAAPGPSTVAVDAPAGWTISTDSSPDVDVVSGQVAAVDHGLQAGSIGGRVEYGSGFDRGIPGVRIDLTGVAIGGTAVTRSTLTGADGTFRFVDVPAGSYRIDETQPPAYTDGPELVGSAGGAIVGSDSIGSIALGAAVVADGYVFTELAADPGSPFVRGVVFEDRDRDGLSGAGDRPMSGMTVELRELGGALLATTTSDVHGVYHFESLTAGAYTVSLSVPLGYGTSNPPMRFGVVVPPDGVHGVDFGLTTSTVQAWVFEDVDLDDARGVSDRGLPGVEVILTGTDASGAPVNRTTSSDAAGRVVFSGVLAGTYDLDEAQPLGWMNGITLVGSAGGTTTGGDDRVSGVVVGAGVDVVDYGFGELAPAPDLAAAIGGVVWLDRDRDALIDAAEPGIAAVDVQLGDAAGRVLGSALTSSGGAYLFTGLDGGDYQVRQIVPEGYGTTTPTLVDTSVAEGSAAVVDFGDSLGSVRGEVFADVDLDRTRDDGEVGLGGVTVTLIGADDGGASFTATTVTDVTGAFVFSDLRAGSYTLVEQQPPNYLDGELVAGDAGGDVAVANRIAAIELSEGQDAAGYVFTELETSVELTAASGRVYLDADRDATPDVGESGLGGVALDLVDVGGSVVSTTISNPDGTYQFAGILAGTYTVEATAPGGHVATTPLAQGPTPVGSDGLTDIDFGLTLPDLAGRVLHDKNGNGVADEGEPGIEGVEIELVGRLDDGGTLNRSSLTDADGRFHFSLLPPGEYDVIEQTPPGWLDGVDGCDCGGTVQDDAVTGIGIRDGHDVLDVWFSERLASSVTGRVWDDTDGDGHQDGDEVGVAETVVRLLDDSGDVVADQVTGPDGSYRFDGVAPGTYQLLVVVPAGRGVTVPDAADDDVDSDVDPTTLRSAPFDVGTTVIPDIDIGLVHQTAPPPDHGEPPAGLPMTGGPTAQRVVLAVLLIGFGALLVFGERNPSRRTRPATVRIVEIRTADGARRRLSDRSGRTLWFD